MGGSTVISLNNNLAVKILSAIICTNIHDKIQCESCSWVMAPCSCRLYYPCFGNHYSLHLQGEVINLWPLLTLTIQVHRSVGTASHHQVQLNWDSEATGLCKKRETKILNDTDHIILCAQDVKSVPSENHH